MAGDTIITVIGNLTDDPELRFTPSGAAVANFTIASTPSTFNRQTNSWEDGETLFLRCAIWRQAAENMAESMQRGQRVMAQGRLKQRTYETQAGEKRTVFELEADEVAASLRYATAKITKATTSRGGAQPQQGGYQPPAGGPDPWATPAPQAPQQGYAPPQQGGYQQQGGQQGGQQSDPWATPAPQGNAQQGAWAAPGVNTNDEPPF